MARVTKDSQWRSASEPPILIISSHPHGVSTTDRTGSDGYVSGDCVFYHGRLILRGTSFSSPIAAGVGALLVSTDSDIRPLECRALMRAGCEKIGGAMYPETDGLERGG